jgi:glycosyltransferase involved in cell wall biosynthesis
MLVSVIIPCYNVEEYIYECIESVFLQTYKDIEVICVDNNSTDNTFAILNSLKESKFPAIHLIKEPRKGASAARNRGISVATGDWIQFLDADDLLMQDKIKHQIDLVLFCEKNDTAFIAGAYERQNLNGERTKIEPFKSDPFKALFTTRLGITSSNLFNSKKLRDIGGWNENLNSSQEATVMFELLKNGHDVIFDDKPMTIIRERGQGQISKIDPNRNWLQYVGLRIQIVNYLIEFRPEYFRTEENFYYQKLFLQIRRLAKFDLETAQRLYAENFGNDFRPSVNIIYNNLFRFWGFRKTERFFGFK